MRSVMPHHFWLEVGYRWRTLLDSVRFRAARAMPRRLRYYAVIVAGAEATTGRYSSTVVPEIMYVDVLKRVDYRRTA